METQGCCKLTGSGTHTCEDLTPCDCNLIPGGVVMGVGTTCQDDFCPDGIDEDCFRCNTQACCLPDGFGGLVCENGSVELCIQQGGQPAGVGSSCIQFGGNHQCSNTVFACCLPDGTCTQATTTTCLFSLCGRPIEGQGPDGNLSCNSVDCGSNVACCLQSGACINASPIDCCSQGGTPAGDGSNCENTGSLCQPFDPPGCRPRNEDRLPDDRLGWTTDLCSNAFFIPYIREPSEYPTDDPDFEAGFVEFITAHPIRAMEASLGQLNAGNEVCKYHIGRLSFSNGWGRVEYCSQPEFSDSQSRKTNYATIHTHISDDPNGIIDAGSTVFVGSYQTPKWQEANFHSYQIVCEEILE